MPKLISTNFFVLLLHLIFLYTINNTASAESDPHKKNGVFYFSWGYNKDWFSKSDIHFKNSATNEYDFTLYGVTAKDRPGFNQILTSDLSIPQYVYRLGYYSSKLKAGIEINFDHAKYVMNQNQIAHLKGRISETYYDTDTVLSKEFVKFEHTNGANFLLLNFVKQHKFHETSNKKFSAGGIIKAGCGIVIPKTDVTLFGERLDNKFHVAGYIFALETGFHLQMFRNFFLEPTVKGSFANYVNVLTVGEGKANHHFFTLEAIFTAGIQFGL
jgi:hypothetical protein